MANIQPDLAPIDWKKLKPQPVIGVDEVGRGCLAGPVYAAAVILNPKAEILEYKDSKLLSAERREEFSEHIIKHHKVALGFAEVEEINRFNILRASFLAMKRAIENLQVGEGLVLVDGNQAIPGIGFKQIAVVKGDQRVLPIAAASIVAKVARDKLMKELGEKFPGYGFEKHKGYCTELHKKIISEKGPTPEHRKFFAGVKEFWEEQSALKGLSQRV